MKVGGAFLAKGAYTCVYDPPVACDDDTPVPQGALVSRIVTAHEGEDKIQNAVREKVAVLEKTYPGQIAQYINISVAACTPKLKQSDIKNSRGESCTIKPQLQTVGVKDEFVNLITPRQGLDLDRTDAPMQILIPALRNLFRAILLLNANDIVHADTHAGNVAWMGDRLVLHDWGMGVTTRNDFINKTIASVQANPQYMKTFAQYVRPCELTEECGLGLYTSRLSVNQTLAVPRLMRVWDTLGLLGYIYKRSDIKQFKQIDRDLTKRTILRIKELVKGTIIVQIANMKAIMDEYFAALEAAIPPVVPPSFGVPRIATPTDEPMNGSTPTDDSMETSPSPGPSWTPSPGLGGPRGRLGGARKKSRTQTRRFCKCIKSVKKTGKTERGAIAICVHSVLQSHGRTMKKFKCGKTARLVTQKAKRRV